MAIDFDNNIMQPLDGQWKRRDGSNPYCGKAYPGDTVYIVANPKSHTPKQWRSREHVGHKATVLDRDRKLQGYNLYTIYRLKCECGSEIQIGSNDFEKE